MTACQNESTSGSNEASQSVPAATDEPTVTTNSTTPPNTATPTSRPSVTASPDKPPVGSDAAVFPDGDIDHGLDPYIRRATDDLAARLGVDTEAITTVSAVLVRWPDSSLGCPQPDMAYATAVTDGSVIELAVGDGATRTVYRYHSGGAERPFLCDQPLRSTPSRG